MYLTLFATNWYMVYHMHRYHGIRNGKVFKQLRHAMQGRMMQNKRAKYSNNSVICSVTLKPNICLETL